MSERFSLAGGRGSLTLTEAGDRIRAEVRLADDGRGLYKAYLLGRGGRFLLGTLVPEGGGLTLDRTLNRAVLEQKRIWPPFGGTAELAFAFGQEKTENRQRSGTAEPGRRPEVRPAPPLPPGWRREPCPARLFGEPSLRNSAQGLCGALLRQEGDRVYLALPWRRDRPFPLTPLFCFAVPEWLGEELYVVFRLNSRGCPVFA